MKLFIKYMVSKRCKIVLKEVLRELGLHHVVVELGEVEIMETITAAQLEQLNIALQVSGLELMDNKKAILIEKIKHSITEMIYHSDELPLINYSAFISKKLNFDYTYLSNIFSEVQGMTIQQFIIINKIERVKELMMYDELNLTEISYKLQYSSLGHLSTQFKKVTGFTPSYFLQLNERRRKPIEDLGNELKTY